MAKNSKPKKETPNKKPKTEKESHITGDLFVDPNTQGNELAVEMNKSDDSRIDNNKKTESEIENENLVGEPKVSLKSDPIENSTTDMSIVGFSLDRPIYLEIHKANLLQYFSSGIIYPTKFSSQKAFADPQSINPDTLIISNGQISKESNDHILIQLSADAFDTNLISKKSNFALYSGVIPISRVQKILTRSTDIKKKIIDDSLIRDGGFIPEDLISVRLTDKLQKITYEETNNITNNWISKLNKYDKILGLIAGARNYSLLTYNHTNSFKSISDHCLFAIKAINNDFANDIIIADSAHISEYYKWLFAKSCPDDRILLKWLFNRVYDDANFTDSDTTDFESICFNSNSFEGEEKQVKDIFSSLNKSLERKKVFSEILKLQSKQSLALYVFAYLRNYATRQNPELARLDLINTRPTKYTEYAFTTLNFFFGYKQHRNSEDRLNITDKKVGDIVKHSSKPPIKFELTTAFDYTVIDYVFNYVFNSEIKLAENNYDKYLNIHNETAVLNIKHGGYKYFSTLLYGKLYQQLSKINQFDELLPILNKLPNEISIFSEFGLLSHRSGLKRNFISLDELISNPKSILKIVYYSKRELIDAIKENKIDFDEIQQRITLSQKYKEIQ